MKALQKKKEERWDTVPRLLRTPFAGETPAVSIPRPGPAPIAAEPMKGKTQMGRAAPAAGAGTPPAPFRGRASGRAARRGWGPPGDGGRRPPRWAWGRR